jgi:hypothetical protein
MECAECKRLMVEFEKVGRSYTAAMKALLARRETAPSLEYVRLRTANDEARIDYESARLDLEQHKRTHAILI